MVREREKSKCQHQILKLSRRHCNSGSYIASSTFHIPQDHTLGLHKLESNDSFENLPDVEGWVLFLKLRFLGYTASALVLAMHASDMKK